MIFIAYASLPTGSFLVISRDRFAALVRLLVKQLHNCDHSFGTNIKIQLVSSTYTPSCQFSRNKNLVVDSSDLTKHNGLKISVMITASTDLYGEERTRHEKVLIQNYEKHNHPKSEQQIPL